MNLYKITWDIEVEASDPVEAARKGNELMDDQTLRLVAVTDLCTYEVTAVDVDELLTQDRIKELEIIKEVFDHHKFTDRQYYQSLMQELAELKGESK